MGLGLLEWASLVYNGFHSCKRGLSLAEGAFTSVEKLKSSRLNFSCVKWVSVV